MDDLLRRELLAAQTPEDKAAVVAESLFTRLPEATARVARQCIILHWFDEAIVEAFSQDILSNGSKSQDIYEQLKHLPFVEVLPWGLALNHLTQEGLLRRYIETGPELLRTAAHQAAPAYGNRRGKKTDAEAFYCYAVAGDTELAVDLLKKLLTKAASRGDWEYIAGLFRLQDEAKEIPFVSPLPLPNKYKRIRRRAYEVLSNPIAGEETIPTRPGGQLHRPGSWLPLHPQAVIPDTIPKGQALSPIIVRLNHWAWQGLKYFWSIIVAGLLLTFVVNTLSSEDFLKWIVQHSLIALPLGIGLILLTLLTATVDRIHSAASIRGWPIMEWVKRILPYGVMVVLLMIAIVSLLVPVSLSTLAITLIPLGMIACILLLIQFFVQILSWGLTQPSKTGLGQHRSTNIMSRRSFLRLAYLSANMGVAISFGYLISRLQALLALLSPTTIVTVVYSTEKEAWLREATDIFNQQWANKGIQVVLVDERGSLEAANNIVSGTSKPTVWSPASSLELHYLSEKWQLLHPGQDIIDYTTIFKPPSLVHSPLVFAVWQSRATALSKAGYNVLDWSDLRDLLSKKRRWSAIGGDASWGDIKFGQTQPDLSTSGLLTIALIAYSYFREQSGLAVENITDAAKNGFQAYLGGIEDYVWCFGPSSGTFIDTVIQRGPPEFDIITTYENLVLTKESEAMRKHEPLVMYYPASLNILSDHPFAILRGDWVTREQERAALQFRSFLLDVKQQQRALTYGFRSSFSSRFYGSSSEKRVPITDPIPGNRFREQPPFLQNQIKSEDDLKPLAQTISGDVINELIKLWQTPTFGYTTRQC